MEDRQIACAIEALIIKGLGVLLRIVQIALGDIGALDPDLIAILIPCNANTFAW